jgi:tetratricopeptide (TPR) repeat protein
MKRVSIGLVLFGVCFLLNADPARDIAEGIRYHDVAQTEPEGNIDRGKALLAPLIHEYPLAKGYYGSLLTLEGGQYEKRNNVLRAMALLDEGIRMIDDAVMEAPDVLDLRMLRMINSYELSVQSPVDRYEIMKTDIDWLVAHSSQMNNTLTGMTELYKGLYYLKVRRLNEAIAAFETCIRVSPNSAEAVEAEKQLRRYAE